MKTSTIEVGGLLSVLSARGVEKQLAGLPGVERVEVNYAAGSATVVYDERRLDLKTLKARVRDCGYHCGGELVPRHVCALEDPPAVTTATAPMGAHAAHEATAHATHVKAAAPAGETDSTAHEMGHGAGMDMQAMVRDMRSRFWICLAFSVPIFVYSPMGGMFTPPAPPFGLPLNVWLFVLGSGAVLYPSWPFVVAAWRAVRNGVLNMAVLVVLSVGTGYLFSVGATFFFGGAQFYEAVAVLLVFILLGHWLEMRARAGASAAIRSLLDMAPPMATVLRDGREVEVPTADALRPTSAAMVQKMRERGVEVAMLTGDNRATAERIARKIGIETVLADVLPGQKADQIKALQARGRKVGMVGDGVNDAPALTQADVGFAIGAGTDVAMESADVVLMKSDPFDVLNAIALSRATLRKMHQNLFWAVAYNVVAFPAAAGVFYPLVISPEVAALSMSGSSVLVAVNALLLKRTDLGGTK